MGHPKFPRKQYDTPLHPWKEERIKSERELIKKYGLKSHREVWKAKTYLGRYRQQARELLAKIGGKDPQVKKESDQLLFHLTIMGILPKGSTLDDVLALDTEAVLSRRLQTLVYLKGFSTTVTQSRQLINHGHIAVAERKVTIPSYMVPKDEETLIGYTVNSALNEISHPARPKTDVIRPPTPPSSTEKKEEKEPAISTPSPEEPKPEPEKSEKPTEEAKEIEQPQQEKPQEQQEKPPSEPPKTEQTKEETPEKTTPDEKKPEDNKEDISPKDESLKPPAEEKPSEKETTPPKSEQKDTAAKEKPVPKKKEED